MWSLRVCSKDYIYSNIFDIFLIFHVGVYTLYQRHSADQYKLKSSSECKNNQ